MARKTPLCCGNRPGTNRKTEPRRGPGAHYSEASYRRAIHRACGQAFPLPPDLARGLVDGKPETAAQWKARLGTEGRAKAQEWRRSHQWSPHRLRKNAATEIRRQFGVEMSATVLGHRSIGINELYAERNEAKAADIINKIG